jgi:hypothetical protein
MKKKKISVRQHRRRTKKGKVSIVKRHNRLIKRRKLKKRQERDIQLSHRELPLSLKQIEWIKTNIPLKMRNEILILALQDLKIAKEIKERKRLYTPKGIIEENTNESSLLKQFDRETGKYAIWRGARTKQYFRWLHKEENDAYLDLIAEDLDYNRKKRKLIDISEFYHNIFEEYPEDLKKKIMFKLYYKIYTKRKPKSYTKDFMDFFKFRFINNVSKKINAFENRLKKLQKDPKRVKKAKENYKTSGLRVYNILQKMSALGFYDIDYSKLQSNMPLMDDDELIRDMIGLTFGFSAFVTPEGDVMGVGTDVDLFGSDDAIEHYRQREMEEMEKIERERAALYHLDPDISEYLAPIDYNYYVKELMELNPELAERYALELKPIPKDPTDIIPDIPAVLTEIELEQT